MSVSHQSLEGFSLVELLAVLAILGVVAALVVTRVYEDTDHANKAACFAHKGDIEIQTELWMNNVGSWPASNLSDIGADVDYFPSGLPTCPVDSSGYTIDSSTGRVIGHVH